MEAGYNKKLQSLNISNDNYSFIHLNIRSVMKNMSHFVNYLQNIHHKFTFIGLSETWINEGTADLFSINGYVCEHLDHVNAEEVFQFLLGIRFHIF